MKYLVLSVLTLSLAACGGGDVRPVTSKAPIERPSNIASGSTINARGLEGIMGKDVGALKRLFGEPRLDVIEVYGRKLQFAGKSCILDAYLYPDGKGGSEVVTHVDARRSDGAEVDRTACVNALQQR